MSQSFLFNRRSMGRAVFEHRALWLFVLLAVALTLQFFASARITVPDPVDRSLPPAPPLQALQLAALGDPVAIARLSSIYMHGFDIREGYAPPECYSSCRVAQRAADP